MRVDKPFIYEIRIEGELSDCWSDWFGGLSIYHEPGGETVLSGPIIDQSALFGVLNKIQALHLVLVSVARSSPRLSNASDIITISQ